MLNLASPAPKERGILIKKSEKQFKKSDESAYSIVPSRMSSRISISTRQINVRGSIRSEGDIEYRRLSFENDLFTARVYKRNYRHPMLLRLWKPKSHAASSITTSVHSVQEKNVDSIHNGKADPVVGRSQQETPTGNVPNAKVPSTPQIRPDRYMEEELERAFGRACEQGNYSMVQAILKLGYDPRIEQAPWDGPGFAAILTATKHGHADIVRLLSKHQVSIEAPTTTMDSQPISIGAPSGNTSVVESPHANVTLVGAEDGRGEQPVHTAAKHGLIETLSTLIDDGAALNCSDEAGRQPLHCAAESSDRPDVIYLLAKSGSQIDAKANTSSYDYLLERPLEMACRRNFPGNVDALLSLSAYTAASDADCEQFESALRTAMSYQSLAALEVLLKHGAKMPERLSSCRKTPLHVYIEHCSLRDPMDTKGLLSLVLQHQNNINAQDENLDTALHYIVLDKPQQYLDLVRVLLKEGADLAICNVHRETPLYLAMKARDIELVKLMIVGDVQPLKSIGDRTLYLDGRSSVALSEGLGRSRDFELYWQPDCTQDNGNGSLYQDLIVNAHIDLRQMNFDCDIDKKHYLAYPAKAGLDKPNMSHVHETVFDGLDTI